MESGSDFEKEILVVKGAVGHAFDDLGFVVHPVEDAGVEQVRREERRNEKLSFEGPSLPGIYETAAPDQALFLLRAKTQF